MTEKRAAMKEALGLYVHIPFCPHRCPYCDFNIVVAKGVLSVDRAAYIARLKEDLIRTSEKLGHPQIRSIFFGGGTPSLLSPEELSGLMEAIHTGYAVEPGAEVSLEANPGTLDRDTLGAFRALGVNRLSIGAQTFHPKGLRALGRGHRPGEIFEAVRLAREARISNINLDLIFGWQDETLEDWREDLERALALEAEHLACYALTVEPGTPLDRLIQQGRLGTPSDDLGVSCFLEAHRLLTSRGYDHYEISNYARTEFHSKHNLSYWLYREYLGFGVGAVSFLKAKKGVGSLFLSLKKLRSEKKTPDPFFCHGVRVVQAQGFKAYLEGPQGEVRESIDRRTAMGEFMMVGLRLLQGVRRDRFAREFGVEMEDLFGDVLTHLGRDGFLKVGPEAVACTEKGLLFQDEVASHFLIEGF